MGWFLLEISGSVPLCQTYLNLLTLCLRPYSNSSPEVSTVWCPILDRSFGWLVLRIHFSILLIPFQLMRASCSHLWFGWNPSTLVFSDWSVLVFQSTAVFHMPCCAPSFLPQKHSFCASIMAVLAVSILEFGRLWGYLSSTFVLNVGYGVWLCYLVSSYLGNIWQDETILCGFSDSLSFSGYGSEILDIGQGERVKFAGFWVEEWQDLPLYF